MSIHTCISVTYINSMELSPNIVADCDDGQRMKDQPRRFQTLSYLLLTGRPPDAIIFMVFSGKIKPTRAYGGRTLAP